MTLAELADRFESAAHHLRGTVRTIVQEEATAAVERMRTEHFVPWSQFGARPPGMLFQRSGRLRFAYRERVTQSADGSETKARFFVAPGDPAAQRAAAVQEFGMTGIGPRFAKALAYPVGEQLGPFGVPRFGGARGARPFYDLFRFRGGRTLYGRPKGQPHRMALRQFVLSRTVSVPARAVARPEVRTAEREIMSRIDAAFHHLLGDAA
jgi:hypothetical protein